MGDEHDYWGVTCGACGKTSFGPMNDQGVAECVWCHHMQRFPSKVLECDHGKEESVFPEIQRVKEAIDEVEGYIVTDEHGIKEVGFVGGRITEKGVRQIAEATDRFRKETSKGRDEPGPEPEADEGGPEADL